MTDEAALLRAILDNPADDTARLVYADRLDELSGAKNAARAEFIRLQCALAHPTLGSDGTGDSGERYKQVMREQALLKKWGAGWLPPFARREAGVIGHRVSGPAVATGAFGIELVYTFARGFIAEARIEVELPPLAEGFGRHAKHFRDLFKAHPVERVRFSVIGFTPAVIVTAVPPEPGHGLFHLRIEAGEEQFGEEVERLTYVAYTREELSGSGALFQIVSALNRVELVPFYAHHSEPDDGYLDHEHW